MPAAWNEIRTNLAVRPAITTIVWVPSHGKTPEWRAPNPDDTQAYRDLNDGADAGATTALNRVLKTLEPDVKLREAAHRRAQDTMSRVLKGSDELRTRYPSTKRSRGDWWLGGLLASELPAVTNPLG